MREITDRKSRVSMWVTHLFTWLCVPSSLSPHLSFSWSAAFHILSEHFSVAVSCTSWLNTRGGNTSTSRSEVLSNFPEAGGLFEFLSLPCKIIALRVKKP